MLSPAAWLAEIEAACASLKESGQGVAAILIDTILSSEGLPAIPAEFVAPRCRDRARARAVSTSPTKCSPVSAAPARHWWGYQRHGVVPDIVTLGKPMANGHPVSGVIARAELATEFAAKVMYFNTFGGNPVSCAAANAVLDVLERERLQENARVVGEYALAGLERLRQRHELIGDVRGHGLFFGAELVTDRRSKTPATAETEARRQRDARARRADQPDRRPRQHPEDPAADAVLEGERGPVACDAGRRPAGAVSRG